MRKLLILLLFVGAMITHANEPSTRPVENRFLFIFETSLMADRSSKAALQAVQDLIESGIQGQMLPGDSFGLWTFNERLDTTFPMQQWIPFENKKLATTTVEFLKKRRYEKKADIKTILPPLFSVMKSSKAITVILISTGNKPIQGTPFDKKINAIYSSYADELRDSKLPFITIFVGRNGVMVDYAVNSALGPFQIPMPPVPLEPSVMKAKVIAPIETNNVIAATNAIAAPPRKFAKSNIIITKESVADASTSANDTTSVSTLSTGVKPIPLHAPAPRTAQTNSRTRSTLKSANDIVASGVSSNQAVDEKSVSAETASLNSTISGAPSAQTHRTEPAVPLTTNEDPTTFKPQATKVGEANSTEPTARLRQDGNHNSVPLDPMAQASAKDEITSPSLVPIAATQPTGAPTKFLTIGIVLLVLAGVLIFFLLRSSRDKTQPSIISRSMDHRK